MSNIPISERHRWIGSSESAALLGVSPHCTEFELWHQKSGAIPAASLDHLERIQAGKHLEPAIAAWGGEKWDDWQPRNVPGYLTHPSVPQMGASLDFEDARTGAVIEVKNVDGLIFRDDWEHEGQTILCSPAHIQVQVQHQLACRPEAPHGWLLVCVGGNRLYRMRVERHPGLIRRIEIKVAAFWASVRSGEPPKPDFTADGAVIAALYGAGNGEVLDLTASNRFPELCAAEADAKAIMKAAKARADAALAEIRDMVGSASGAYGSDGWKVTVSDIKAAEIAATTRRGYRRFTVKQKKDASA
jgi:putative phage-type endonuclease